MKIKKIVLDTDLGDDCDDAGALSVLHNLVKSGKAELISVTHCGSEISGAVSVKMINEWYGCYDVPIGRYDKKQFLEEDRCKKYTLALMTEYLKRNTMPKFESSVRVLRRALAENENVTIVTIGVLNNIAELLKSEGDDISPLSGAELVEKNVKEMYTMGGNFTDSEWMEYNVKKDAEATYYVTEKFSKPIVYCGFEIGVDIITGRNLELCDKENPIRLAYGIFNRWEGFLHNSYDLVTVYAAILQESGFYKKSDALNIRFDNMGRTLINGAGKDYYLIQTVENEVIEKALDELFI